MTPIDEAAAERLFPQAAAGEQKLTPSPDAPVAVKLFPQAAQEQADKVKAQEQQAQPKPAAQQAKPQQAQQPKPAPQGEQARAGQQQAPTPQALELAGHLAAQTGLEADHPDTASFSSLATEMGLSKENAVKLATWDAERNSKAWDKLADDWHTEAKADVLYQDNVTAGNSLISEFGDDRLMQEVIDQGYGSHPAVLTFLGKIGRALERARRNR